MRMPFGEGLEMELEMGMLVLLLMLSAQLLRSTTYRFGVRKESGINRDPGERVCFPFSV